MKNTLNPSKLLVLLLILSSCQTGDNSPASRASDYDFPKPVDTSSKVIFEQTKKTYDLDGILVDNEFDAARLNNVSRKNDTLLVVKITPENEPINFSPWYAFRLSSENDMTIHVSLDYGDYKHRYTPKVSADRMTWTEINEMPSFYNEDSTTYTFPVNLAAGETYVAAQEIFSTGDLKNWITDFARSPLVKKGIVGKSAEGRDLHVLDIFKGEKERKKLLIIFSRQHPPEVTGFFAMQSFVKTILEQGETLGFLDDYRILIYPMLNPDGVDMGHWRHNSNGVDLNRDWAYYNQPEIRQIADHVVREAHENNSQVVFGLDFHSTYNDVYYTQAKEELNTPTTEWFRDQWFDAIEARIPGYRVNEKPSGLGGPVSKGWFYTQFKAEGMTYEIGDKTPRDSIQLIGKITCEDMMNVLITNSEKLD